MNKEQDSSKVLAKDNKIYFPNLNGLRFFAAFVVLLGHLEQMKEYYLDIEPYQFLKNPDSGQLGVILFFALSGFLITYLLLLEEDKTKTISIKDFYIRRVLRIWPLYYFLILLVFFVLRYIPFFELPHVDVDNAYSPRNLMLYLMILPNVVIHAFESVIPYIGHSWSIGVEEQFYIIWPLLMKFVKKKERLLIGVIVVYLLMKYALLPVLHDVTGNYHLYLFYKIWNKFSISCMAIGGLFAVWHYKKRAIVKVLYNPILNWCIVLFLCTTLFTTFRLPYLNYEFFALLFGILILNMATNPNPIINFENRVFNYLGKISYGLYMYHIICVVIAVKLLAYLGIYAWEIQVIFSLGITVLVSSLSYYGFEQRFIRMKGRFSKILSGDNAAIGKKDE
ncbi:acyltransferase [Prevotella sp. 10(H)]|uniref:acyltransferase family protein n=1 Tax=Prevotella sp. 10(H) TaxID=1158294 RepID=UPI0004A6CED5|nr:acyltransferase [Prevotella sp. 10(H)]